MITEPRTTPADPNYNIHRIDFLNNPAPAGRPPWDVGAGVITASEEGTDRHCTMLVDHDYALFLLEARRDLDGPILGAGSAVRWLRAGWPEEWDDPALNPMWAQIYPASPLA